MLSPTRPLPAPQRAMRKLGLEHDIDLALHLPLRYKEEQRIVSIAWLREGDMAQDEGVVLHCGMGRWPEGSAMVKPAHK